MNNSNKELTHFINDNAKIEEKNKVSLNSKKNNNTNNNIRKLFCYQICEEDFPLKFNLEKNDKL